MTLGIVRLVAGLAAVKLGAVLLSVVCWALTTERRLDAFGERQARHWDAVRKGRTA